MENPAARSARSEAPLVTVEQSETGPSRPEAREPYTAWRYAEGMRLQVDREAESARSEAPLVTVERSETGPSRPEAREPLCIQGMSL